jgi:hypothetical protein
MPLSGRLFLSPVLIALQVAIVIRPNHVEEILPPERTDTEAEQDLLASMHPKLRFSQIFGVKLPGQSRRVRLP